MAPLPKLVIAFPKFNEVENGNRDIFGSTIGYGRSGPGRWNGEWLPVKQPPGAGIQWYPWSPKSLWAKPWAKLYEPYEKPNPGGPWAQGFDMAQLRWLKSLPDSRLGKGIKGGIKAAFQNWLTGLIEAHLNKKCHKNPESLSDCYQRLGKEKEDACIANPKAKGCMFILDEYCEALCQGCLGKSVAPTCLTCADALGTLQTAVKAEMKRGIEFVQSEYAKAKGWNGTMEPLLEVVAADKDKQGKKKDNEEKRSPVGGDAPSTTLVANTTAPPRFPLGNALTFHSDNQVMLAGWQNGTNTTAQMNLTEFSDVIGGIRSHVQTHLTFLDSANLARVRQMSEPVSGTTVILTILGLVILLILVIGGAYRAVKSHFHRRARWSTVNVTTLTEDDVEMEQLMKEEDEE